MAVKPGMSPVASPVASIVAMLGSLLAQMTRLPRTVTDVDDDVVVPSPSWPESFRPQH